MLVYSTDSLGRELEFHAIAVIPHNGNSYAVVIHNDKPTFVGPLESVDFEGDTLTFTGPLMY